MRILTVRQPWAWAIVHGGKDVENRVQNLAGTRKPFRGLVAIHAAQGVGTSAEFMANSRRVAALSTPVPFGLAYGAIIGVVDLVDVHHETSDRCGDSVSLCSDWADSGVHHLVLANPRPIADPIPYRGALGLRTLDEATTARVLEAIA